MYNNKYIHKCSLDSFWQTDAKHHCQKKKKDKNCEKKFVIELHSTRASLIVETLAFSDVTIKCLFVCLFGGGGREGRKLSPLYHLFVSLSRKMPGLLLHGGDLFGVFIAVKMTYRSLKRWTYFSHQLFTSPVAEFQIIHAVQISLTLV